MTPPAQRRGAVVRDSVEDDIASIRAIYAHYVLNELASFEEVVPDAAEIERRRAEVLKGRLPYLVADVNGAARGFAYAAPYRLRSAYRFTVEDSVYVAPDATGRGVGGALLRELIERCTALGYRQMVAVIGDSANLASILLHEKHGFRRVGVLECSGFKLGRWVDTVVMQRPLGEADATLPAL